MNATMFDERAVTRPTVSQWVRRQLASRELSRRAVLGGIGGLTLFGCSGGSGPSTTAATGGTSTTTTGTTTSATTPTTGNCVLIPQETIGPYPLFDDIASAAAYRDVSDADRTANRATGGYDAELTVGIAI